MKTQPEETEFCQSVTNMGSAAESEESPGQEEAWLLGSCKWFNVTKGWGFLTPHSPLEQYQDPSTPQKPQTIQIYTAPETPQKRETTQTPQAPKTPQKRETSQNAPETPQKSHTNQIPQALKTPQKSESVQNTVTPQAPLNHQTSKGPPQTLETNQTCKSPDNCDEVGESSAGDVFVHQSCLQMKGFRCLAQGEQVEFQVKFNEDRWEAVAVRGVHGVDCVGTRRKYKQRHKKKIRCFNCGDIGDHLAAVCPEPSLPKRCHNCKSESHLIAECPTLNKTECNMETIQ